MGPVHQRRDESKALLTAVFDSRPSAAAITEYDEAPGETAAPTGAETGTVAQEVVLVATWQSKITTLRRKILGSQL